MFEDTKVIITNAKFHIEIYPAPRRIIPEPGQLLVAFEALLCSTKEKGLTIITGKG